MEQSNLDPSFPNDDGFHVVNDDSFTASFFSAWLTYLAKGRQAPFRQI